MSTSPPDSPWYHRGLRFRCTGCGNCCTGGPGYVWVTPEDVEAMARERALDPATFGRHYVRQVEGRYSLTERANGSCVFLDETNGHCTIYGARPTQCRTYPFWPQLVDSRASWEHEARSCPGIGEPTVVPAAEIERQRSCQARNRARPDGGHA